MDLLTDYFKDSLVGEEAKYSMILSVEICHEGFQDLQVFALVEFGFVFGDPELDMSHVEGVRIFVHTLINRGAFLDLGNYLLHDRRVVTEVKLLRRAERCVHLPLGTKAKIHLICYALLFGNKLLRFLGGHLKFILGFTNGFNLRSNLEPISGVEIQLHRG